MRLKNYQLMVERQSSFLGILEVHEKPYNEYSEFEFLNRYFSLSIHRIVLAFSNVYTN